MTMLRYYPAIIDHDAGTDFGVTFPDFPGCVTTGETVQQAAVFAAEALAFHVEGMVEDGDTIPDPSAPDVAIDGEGSVVARVLVPVEVPGRVVRANISLDEGLLSRLDNAAAAAGMSRSGFIAEAVRHRLSRAREIA
jgi:predicted RNase H-like HicB family nuclease